MSRKRRRHTNKPNESAAPNDNRKMGGEAPREEAPDQIEERVRKKAEEKAPHRSEENVSVGQWHDEQRLKRRTFPGPRDANAILRVAIDRTAYADVVAHAKQSLDAEICGVLVGAHCRDGVGPFVHVEAAVRGSQANEGSVHVTYTQETWNDIHAIISRDYPKLQIVGWYHSHPGFGVEFSDMDVFIQKNFFSGPTQIALVTDPLGGDVAICKNAAEGIEYIDRFWVDGRQQQCFVPARHQRGVNSSGGLSEGSHEVIGALETRVSQLVQSVDEMRQSFYRWLTMIGMLVAMVVVFLIANQIYSMLFPSIAEPPKGISFAPVPVMVDGKPCVLGVRIVKWNIPPELIAVSKEEASPDEARDQKKSNTDERKSKPNAANSPRPAGTNKSGADKSATNESSVDEGKPTP